MIEKEFITLENGDDYIVVDEIDNYVYLTNEKNNKDFCIRKSIKENDKEFVVGLENEEEFNKALALFKNTYDN